MEQVMYRFKSMTGYFIVCELRGENLYVVHGAPEIQRLGWSPDFLPRYIESGAVLPTTPEELALIRLGGEVAWG